VIDIAALKIEQAIVEHPLLGPSHVIAHAGAPITAMSAIDWDRPTQIPAIAEPRRLPPGSGTLLMNLIAERARDAAVPALRYAGPYPTHALFRTLLQSFRTTGTEEEFTRDALGRAVRVDRSEIPIDFRPAPFERLTTSYGHLDLRDEIVERAMIDRVMYGSNTDSFARLLRHGALYEAEFAVDGHRVERIAVFHQHGALDLGPSPLPKFPTPAVDVFPKELAAQLADLATTFVPAPLAADVQRLIATRPIRWADLAEQTAKRTDDGFSLHVAFLAIAKLDMSRFAQLLSYHLARIAQAAVLDEVLSSSPASPVSPTSRRGPA
jgi:hypothetical protein